MWTRRIALFLTIAFLVFLVPGPAQVRTQAALSQLKTRAERSNFEETSRYDDVMSFLNTVSQNSELVHMTTMGYTQEGRALPLAIVGRVSDARPETIKASGKLRIYIQANVHSGEVEGKEAAQALVRDIALGRYNSWLESMVLLVGPDYNADGNEKISLTNRGQQNGPVGGMGTRANAQGLNINRDYMKLETPEARSMARLLNDYDPHIMMDLHTTDGSRHAYYLTYETPNNPAVEPSIDQMSQEWMASVTRTIQSKYGWNIHAYGNVGGRQPDRVWITVEDLPRYSHNYWGLRNRFGILSETYSYLTFKDRIMTDTRFLEEVLNYANANAAKIKKATEDADKRSIIGQHISLRSKLKRSDQMVEILMGDTENEVNPYSGRNMLRRIDVVTPEKMWAESSFESTDQERVPSAYYIPGNLTAAIERLQAHGIRMERLSQPTAALQLEEFQIATNDATPQAFENHRERTVTGTYMPVEQAMPDGTYRVSMNQPLARLAFYLLEPRSNDGLMTWNFLDDAIKDGKVAPILRTRD
jgi:Zinc carboxypeptidase